MRRSEIKKNEQLGMSYGKARNMLIRLILFDLVNKLGLDKCFRCGLQILSPEDLTIEHKLPWLDKSTALFWDLSNIAFSHFSCNTPHTRHGGKFLRKVAPDGNAWCNMHKQFLPVDKFDRSRDRWNGYCQQCKECRKKLRKIKQVYG